MISYDQALPNEHCLRALTNFAQDKYTLHENPFNKDAGEPTLSIAAYDGQKLIGFGSMTVHDGKDKPEIIVHPAYENREVARNIKKLLHAKLSNASSQSLG